MATNILPVVTDLADEASRHASLMAARMLSIAEDAWMAMQRFEAWIVVGQSADGMAPSHSERHKEGVLVSLARRVGGRLTRLSSVSQKYCAVLMASRPAWQGWTSQASDPTPIGAG